MESLRTVCMHTMKRAQPSPSTLHLRMVHHTGVQLKIKCHEAGWYGSSSEGKAASQQARTKSASQSIEPKLARIQLVVGGLRPGSELLLEDVAMETEAGPFSERSGV